MKSYSKIILLSLVIGGMFFFTGEALAKLDLIFVIDLTGSMWDDIEEVQEQASAIVDEVSEVSGYRIAIVGYRDLPDPVTFEDYPFSRDKEEILANINSLTTTGGGDTPEAVYEALLRAINTEAIGDWRDDVSKAIILMGDAPPHEKGDIGSPPADYKYTLEDVAEAAYEVDPANIYSVVIGDNSDAAEKFEELADETDGSFFSAADAEDVPERIMAAAKEIVEEAEKREKEETDWGRIILYIVIGLAVALLIVIAIVVVIVVVLKKK